MRFDLLAEPGGVDDQIAPSRRAPGLHVVTASAACRAPSAAAWAQLSVSGRMRSPRPAARIMACARQPLSCVRRAAVQRALLGPFRLEAVAPARSISAARLGRMVGAEVADIDVERHGALLGPGVQAHVRLGQQHRGRDAARPVRRAGKGVEQLVDRLQAGRLARPARTSRPARCASVSQAASQRHSYRSAVRCRPCMAAHCSSDAARRAAAAVGRMAAGRRTRPVKSPGFP